MAMSYEEISFDAEERMEKSMENLNNDLRSVRTGRAAPALVENIRVDYYGTPTPLKQMSTISVSDARTLVIKPFDAGVLKEIEKAIIASDLGLNPSSDGKLLRISVPQLSQERRKQMAGMVKEIGEKARVALRNIRRDSNKHADTAKGEKTMTEDVNKALKDEIQKLMEQYEKKVDEAVNKKSHEILEI